MKILWFFLLSLLCVSVLAQDLNKDVEDVEPINTGDGSEVISEKENAEDNPPEIPNDPKTTPVLASTEKTNDEKDNDDENITPKPKPSESVDEGAEMVEGIKRTFAKTGRLLNYDYNDANYDPMTSNIAPSEDLLKGDPVHPYVMNPTRLEEIRKNFMYPYYNRGGNIDDRGDYQTAIQQSSPQIHKNFNFQLPFFGFRFNYTRVSLNGYLEFSDPPPSYVNYPLVFPNKNWPAQNDPSFIGVFYSRSKVGSIYPEDVDQRDPGVYFRLERDLRGRVDRLGVELYERVKWDIREGVVGSETFDPKHMIIVTWKNVTFLGGWANANYKTNTYQLILATDEVFTYAIFNYNLLTWTSHTEAGGSVDAGEGGVTAYVGFNAGNGTRSYEYVPYSQASVIRDLTLTGFANGFPGRHIFRIDENIMLGTCNKDIDGANLPLVFAPESGNMLGGTIVNVTGPCFEPNQQIRCAFDVGNIVYGKYISRNRVICVQPRLFIEGWISLQISINGGPYKYKGKYYVESPAFAAQKIYFKDESYAQANPKEIKISWEKYNLTTNENANIRMSLWGYREYTIRPDFLYITELEANVQNLGEYTIQPSQYRNRDNEFLTDLTFGFIQMNITETITVKNPDGSTFDVEINPTIWSRPIPLGWYFGPQWERQYGKDWAKALCNNWLREDRYLKNFAHQLPQCPCTLDQALADKGRFLPDLDCDKDTNRDCKFNDKAEHCVKSGSPTLDGAEQQCCYDKNKYLMMSYDQQWGSSPRRCHNLGYLPWNEATKVPTLSQWRHDIIPKYLCCLWQEEQAVGCETIRFERRPTQDCVAYQAPGIAGIYGDPHIITFDDYQYTFNGKGEFVLVKTYSKTTNLEVQGRFEQMPMNAYGQVPATQLSSIVARGNSSTIIEIRARPKEARWRYRLDVFADGKRIFFDRPSLKFQHFPGVTIYTPTYIFNQSEVIVMFDTGAGVEVVENEGFLSARVYLPWNFINQTRGLLGNWSFNMEDDFMLPNGNRVSVPTQTDADPGNLMKTIYETFGLEWMLDDNEVPNVGRSLFHREFAQTASNYNNRSFVPMYYMTPENIIPANRSAYIQQAYQACFKDNRECLYDFSVTLNKDVAHFTTNYKATILKYKEISREKVVSCGVLETPRFGRKNTFLFVPGTDVTFECNTDFVLVGDQKRTCLPDGTWNVPDYGYTECLRQQEYSSRQAAVTWGIILAVLVPLILLILFATYKVYRNHIDNTDSTTWAFNPASRKASSTFKPPIPDSPPQSDEDDEDDDDDDDDDDDEDDIKKDKTKTSTLGSRGSLGKKRRSYDGSYRTHEPIKGLPDIQFEEKPFDLDEASISSPSSPNSQTPRFTNLTPPQQSERVSSPSSTVTDV